MVTQDKRIPSGDAVDLRVTNRHVARWVGDTGNIGLGLGSTAPAFPLTFGQVAWGTDHGNGASIQRGYVTELVTVAAAATTTSTVQIPAGARVVAVTYRVTVQPTGTTSFGIGVSGSATRFGSSVSSNANTTGVSYGDNTRYASATGILITPNTSPSDALGRIRVVVEYELATAPTA